MKRFLKETLLIGTIFFVVIYSFFNTPYSLYFNRTNHVFETLQLTKNKINTNTVLVGDSVCRQFFEEFNTNEVFCLCSNQAYEVVGNYLILKELIKNKSKFKRLILVINPLTLTSELNQIYTYNYFYKPFKYVLDNFDYETESYLNKIFGDVNYEPKYKFSQRQFFDNPFWYYFDKPFMFYEKNYEQEFKISKINSKYIKKIQSICEENGIEFKMILPPLPEAWEKEIIKNFNNSDLNQFSKYFSSGVYYPDEISIDGTHIKNPREFILNERFVNYSNKILF